MAIIYRELEIRFPNGDYQTITGSNILSESMTITKSICDDGLKLGGCIATQFELQVIGINPDNPSGNAVLEHEQEDVHDKDHADDGDEHIDDAPCLSGIRHIQEYRENIYRQHRDKCHLDGLDNDVTELVKDFLEIG